MFEFVLICFLGNFFFFLKWQQDFSSMTSCSREEGDRSLRGCSCWPEKTLQTMKGSGHEDEVLEFEQHCDVFYGLYLFNLYCVALIRMSCGDFNWRHKVEGLFTLFFLKIIFHVSCNLEINWMILETLFIFHIFQILWLNLQVNPKVFTIETDTTSTKFIIKHLSS